MHYDVNLTYTSEISNHFNIKMTSKPRKLWRFFYFSSAQLELFFILMKIAKKNAIFIDFVVKSFFNFVYVQRFFDFDDFDVILLFIQRWKIFRTFLHLFFVVFRCNSFFKIFFIMLVHALCTIKFCSIYLCVWLSYFFAMFFNCVDNNSLF